MNDTPTHRMHILQAKLQRIVQWTQELQTRRAHIVEKVVRATANNKITRALQVERSLDRSIALMLRDLKSTDEKLNKIADRLNKCRGLLLELSDGEVLLERSEVTRGNHAESEADRGTVSQGTGKSTSNGSAGHVSGAAASTASAGNGTSKELQSNAGLDAGCDTQARRA